MILLAIALYFASQLSTSRTSAAPISYTLKPEEVAVSSNLGAICSDGRTLTDILWSCLATIFACSWVSVHPNIPATTDSGIRIVFRRLELMFWAIIAPDVIIFWAMRQWFGARTLGNLYRDYGWTKTHGYFMQMGGFTLYKNDQPRGTLTPDLFLKLIENGEINFPALTEKEIQDRSKGDALSKGLAVGQTSWFVVQCIARHIEGLNVTGLEITTAALAVFNATIYFFWWNKPLDVRCSVPVYLLEVPGPQRTIKPSQRTAICVSIFKGDIQPRPPSKSQQKIVFFVPTKLMPEAVLWMMGCVFSDWHPTIWEKLIDMAGSGRAENIYPAPPRVATFYAHRPTSEEFASIGYTIPSVAALFGAIHCAGWTSIFPTPTEATLWRISAVYITGMPLGMLSVAFGFTVHDAAKSLGRLALARWARRISITISAFLLLVGTPLYGMARMCFLFEAAIGLRHLSPGDLAVVEWAKFIPHI
ncbi:hypothetical protein BDN70DRAFT_981818 [Pholiota conissans]|uniref:Uncharacterized protein n=1 Tax=Pholiota conissans TaxID=109636 RepID=A0A9P6CSK9_9AGAR|nr:hypothetical protein BDN70DRAFT_981818 [Pholiota conissans]